MSTIKINNRKIGHREPTFLIAEIAQAHDGSLGIAHSFIDVAAEAGADAVKFQTHIAEHESTLDEPFRTDFSWEDETRYEYWERMEFTNKQWQELADHARSEGLVFLSSAFCKPAVDLLKSVKVPAWKVGSGEYKSSELVEYMAETGKPVLFSTGMSTLEEVDSMVEAIEQHAPYALFQCTSNYPTDLKNVGLNVIDELTEQYDCPVGLSDHSGSIYPGLAAIARGIDLLEVHLTFDQRMFGPDSEASVTPDELETLAQMRDAVQIMDENPVAKDEVAESLTDTRSFFTKSIAPVKDLSAGTKLTEEVLAAKKPGSGIPYENRDEVIGSRLSNDISPDRLLTWDDIDE
jgi:N-acetylneuraminate synthase